MAYQASYPDMADDTDAGSDASATMADDQTPEGETDGTDQSEEDDGDAENSVEESALIPKSLLAGKEFKPGEEIVLEIVKMHGDEVEVRYAKEKGGDSEMSKADGKLAKMGGY